MGRLLKLFRSKFYKIYFGNTVRKFKKKPLKLVNYINSPMSIKEIIKKFDIIDFKGENITEILYVINDTYSKNKKQPGLHLLTVGATDKRGIETIQQYHIRNIRLQI